MVTSQAQPNQRRVPEPYYNKMLKEGGWDNRDQACQKSDGTVEYRRTIGEQECHGQFSSWGNFTEGRGGKPGPKDEELNAGGRIEFTSDNVSRYAKGGENSTLDNNVCSVKGGDTREGSYNDAHQVKGKNSSYVNGDQLTIASMGGTKIATRGSMTLSSGKGDVSIAAARGIHMKAKEGQVLAQGQGTVYSHTKAGSRGAHVENHSDGKIRNVSKKDQDQIGQENWNGNFQGEIDHESKQDANYTSSGGDMVHAVPSGFQYLGQDAKKKKEGCFVLTVCGPAKKVKALA